jgi:hypothetical protein
MISLEGIGVFEEEGVQGTLGKNISHHHLAHKALAT